MTRHEEYIQHLERRIQDLIIEKLELISENLELKELVEYWKYQATIENP
jgi:hypothetical protein